MIILLKKKQQVKEETAGKFKYTLFVRFNFDTNSGTSELPFLIYSNQNTTLKEVDNINMKVLSNMYKDSCSKEGLYIDACVVRAKKFFTKTLYIIL